MIEFVASTLHEPALFWAAVEAVGTIAAAAIIIWQLRLARQEAIVEQAQAIACWIEREDMDRTWILVQNSSSQPIHEVVVAIVQVGESGWTEDSGPWTAQSGSFHGAAPLALPGQGFIPIKVAAYGGMHRRFGASIAFRDARGRNWLRRGNGELIQLTESPTKHYEFPLPMNWSGYWRELPAEPQNLGNDQASR